MSRQFLKLSACYKYIENKTGYDKTEQNGLLHFRTKCSIIESSINYKRKRGSGMKCLNCGKEVLTEDKFCPFCGKEIPQEEELKPKAEERAGQRKDEGTAVPKGSGSSSGGKGQGLKGGKRV